MFNNYVEKKVYFDESTSVGETKYGHVIIEQDHNDGQMQCSIVIYKEILNYIYKSIEKSIGRYEKNQKIYEKNESGIKTEVYLDNKNKEVTITQDKNQDIIIFGAELLLEIFAEILEKKNEGV